MVGTIAALLALLALRWLLVQLRRDRLRRLALDPDESDDDYDDDGPDGGVPGHNHLAGRRAHRRRRRPGHRRTRRTPCDRRAVRPDRLELWLSLSTTADADLGALRSYFVETVVPAARTALELPELPTYVGLVVTARSGPRAVA